MEENFEVSEERARAADDDKYELARPNQLYDKASAEYKVRSQRVSAEGQSYAESAYHEIGERRLTLLYTVA